MTVRAETEITLMRSDDGVTFGSNEVTAGTAGIFPLSLAMRNADDKWESLTLTGGTGTTKAKNEAGFHFDRILHNDNDQTYAADTTTGRMDVAKSIDLRYSTNCGTTLTAGAAVYIVGAVEESMFYLDDTWWTQTEPTTEDGLYYIYLGMAYSSSEVYLVEAHTVWTYRSGRFRQLTDAELDTLEDNMYTALDDGLTSLETIFTEQITETNTAITEEATERAEADNLKVDIGSSGINSLDNNIKFDAANGLQIYKPVGAGEDEWKVIVASNGVLLALNQSTVASIQQYNNTTETLMKANNALMSVLRLRSSDNGGCLGIVAQSNGHVTMKEV